MIFSPFQFLLIIYIVQDIGKTRVQNIGKKTSKYWMCALRNIDS